MFNRQNIFRSLVLVAASAAVSAHAALPEAVPTAITGFTTDGGTLVGLLAAAGAAVYLIGKLLRRFGLMA